MESTPFCVLGKVVTYITLFKKDPTRNNFFSFFHIPLFFSFFCISFQIPLSFLQLHVLDSHSSATVVIMKYSGYYTVAWRHTGAAWHPYASCVGSKREKTLRTYPRIKKKINKISSIFSFLFLHILFIYLNIQKHNIIYTNFIFLKSAKKNFYFVLNIIKGEQKNGQEFENKRRRFATVFSWTDNLNDSFKNYEVNWLLIETKALPNK